MAEDDNRPTESTRDVLMDALVKVSTMEAPTARDVLKIMIRMECARAGLPVPDFDCFPASDVIKNVMFPD